METIKIKKMIDVIPEGTSTLVCGLPGIGNVGRITVDYMIDKLKMEKVLSIPGPLSRTTIS